MLKFLPSVIAAAFASLIAVFRSNLNAGLSSASLYPSPASIVGGGFPHFGQKPSFLEMEEGSDKVKVAWFLMKVAIISTSAEMGGAQPASIFSKAAHGRIIEATVLLPKKGLWRAARPGCYLEVIPMPTTFISQSRQSLRMPWL